MNSNYLPNKKNNAENIFVVCRNLPTTENVICGLYLVYGAMKNNKFVCIGGFYLNIIFYGILHFQIE